MEAIKITREMQKWLGVVSAILDRPATLEDVETLRTGIASEIGVPPQTIVRDDIEYMMKAETDPGLIQRKAAVFTRKPLGESEPPQSGG